ncbi:ATP-binding protein [Nannocystis bainbridge]|uniref:histidine kinase n=1 Tax=Nannocystis bainbridge TaxID=2995303 RepID=A0ABT5DNN9_9BACT|nr:ATP-binding protein [Nannocystis bainbridge]MDC0715272.1 ATP-binding protein [Nannocystis bainbridge]
MLKTVRVPPRFEPLFEQAQEFVGRIFAERSDIPDKGRIEVFGQRYMLVRARAMSVEFFEMVQRLYRDKGQDEALGVARSLLFDIAHAMGLSDANDFAERMHLQDPIARLSAGPIHFSHSGWAFVDISPESRPAPDESFYLLYDHPYSFESDSWIDAGKRPDFPVCVMNAGYSSGWCEASFGVPLVATEILCRAKGDDHCRFIMAHPSRIEGYIDAYLHGQPHLAAHVTRYEIPGFFSRKQQEDELKSREEQYRGIFEAGTNALLILDEAGVIVQANPAASRLFRCSRPELAGRSFADLLNAGADLFARLRAAVHDHGHFLSEGTATATDGRTYVVELRGARFRLQNRDHLLAVLTDITEQNRAQLALRQAHDELEQRVRERTAELERLNQQLHLLNGQLVSARDSAIDASRAKSAFLANMSHELRTPLNAIIGYSELLEDESGEEGRQHLDLGDLGKIRGSARHLLALINDILDVSKIEAGKMELFVEDFAVDELVAEVVATIEPLVRKNDNRLEITTRPGLGAVALDRTKVKQIIINLLGNACKFTHSGVIGLLVAREDGPHGEQLVVAVQDTGIGIDPTRLEELFQPFRQADESTTRKYGGTGLGLSISRHYAEMMRGRIDARSAPGQGSTFTVTLPLSARGVEAAE